MALRLSCMNLPRFSFFLFVQLKLHSYLNEAVRVDFMTNRVGNLHLLLQNCPRALLFVNQTFKSFYAVKSSSFRRKHM